MRGDNVEEVQVCCKDDDRGMMMSNEVSPGDGESGEGMCDDEMNTRTHNKSDDNTTPTPSSGEACRLDDEKGSDQDVSVCGSVTNDDKQECKIMDGVCINGCRTRTISYTIKKRVMNKKTLLWYDRSVRITKSICVKTRYDAQSNLAKRV